MYLNNQYFQKYSLESFEISNITNILFENCTREKKNFKIIS